MRRRFLGTLAIIAVLIWGPIAAWYAFDLDQTPVGRFVAIPIILALVFGGWILLRLAVNTFFGGSRDRR